MWRSISRKGATGKISRRDGLIGGLFTAFLAALREILTTSHNLPKNKKF